MSKRANSISNTYPESVGMIWSHNRKAIRRKQQHMEINKNSHKIHIHMHIGWVCRANLTTCKLYRKHFVVKIIYPLASVVAEHKSIRINIWIWCFWGKSDGTVRHIPIHPSTGHLKECMKSYRYMCLCTYGWVQQYISSLSWRGVFFLFTMVVSSMLFDINGTVKTVLSCSCNGCGFF